MRRAKQSGFTLVESLVGLVVLMLIMGGVYEVLVHNARINKSQKLIVETQANARTCLSLLVSRLRSAGWDPLGAGVGSVTLDPRDIDANHADGVDNVEVFADINGDGETDGTATADDDGEELLIRLSGNRVEWRDGPSGSFEVVAVDISNDADGNGTAEPMFVPDSATDPTRITVRVTAESPVLDPVTGEIFRYTVSSDVMLRKFL